jgi:hypothetical protein
MNWGFAQIQSPGSGSLKNRGFAEFHSPLMLSTQPRPPENAERLTSVEPFAHCLSGRKIRVRFARKVRIPFFHIFQAFFVKKQHLN